MSWNGIDISRLSNFKRYVRVAIDGKFEEWRMKEGGGDIQDKVGGSSHFIFVKKWLIKIVIYNSFLSIKINSSYIANLNFLLLFFEFIKIMNIFILWVEYIHTCQELSKLID